MGLRLTREKLKRIRVVGDLSGVGSCRQDVLFCFPRCEELKVERQFS